MPEQPSLPAIQLQGLAAVLPLLNSSYFPGSSYHYPGVPGMVAPQQPPVSYSDLQEIMSRHPLNQNRGNTGFQANQVLQVGPQGSLIGMGMNAIASMGIEAIVDKIAPGAGQAMKLMPMQQVEGMSRFDYFRTRQRELIADRMFSGSPSVLQSNPDLQFFSNQGIANSPLFQNIMGMNGYRSAFQTTFGQFGSAFGGNILAQGLGSARFQAAVSAGFRDPSGMGFNTYSMQGLGFEEIMGGLGAARNMGFFGVTSEGVREMARDVKAASIARDKGNISDAKILEERAAAMGGRWGRGTADALAAGRDIWGQKKDAYEIFTQMERTLGREGMQDAGAAAGRLREIEAAAQTLNMDSQAVTKYMQVMKQMAKNAGVVGEAANSSALRSMLSIEATTRDSDKHGVQYSDSDKTRLAAGTANFLTRNLGSMDAHTKSAMTTILGENKGDLANISLNVGGRNMTAADVYARLQEGNRRRRDKEMSPAEMDAFEKFQEQAVVALGNAGGKGKELSLQMAQRARNWDAGENSASASATGTITYEEAVTGGGVTKPLLDFERNAKLQISDADRAWMNRGGGQQKLLQYIRDHRGFSAAFTGKNLVDHYMSEKGGGMSREQAERMANMTRAFTSAYRTENPQDSYDTAKSALLLLEKGAVGREEEAAVAKEQKENFRTREIFSKALGGAFGGNKTVTNLLLDFGREVMRGQAADPEKKEKLRDIVSKALGRAVKAQDVESMIDLMSGSENSGYVDAQGNRHTINTLGKELDALDAQGGTEAQKQARRDKAQTDFIKKSMEQNPNLKAHMITVAGDEEDAAKKAEGEQGISQVLSRYEKELNASQEAEAKDGGLGGGAVAKTLADIYELGQSLVTDLRKLLGIDAGGTTQKTESVPHG